MRNLFIFLVLTLVLSVNLYAQENRADVSGPFNVPGKTSTVEARNSGLKSNTENKPMQTDEYGLFNRNAAYTINDGQYAAAYGIANENFDGSIECWIYWNGGGPLSPAIIAKGDASNIGFYLGISSSSGNVLFLRFGNTATINTGGTAIATGVWTHVAVTWSGTAGNHSFTFYVNGAISGAPVASAGLWNVTSDSLTVGYSKAFSTSSQFLGKVDEIRYWSDVRTLAEIRDNRFVGLGDGTGVNTGNALTSAADYADINNSWTFNTGSYSEDPFGSKILYFKNGSNTTYNNPIGNPIPYNLALKLNGGANNYVTIPDASVFDQTVAGGLDAWIYLTTASTLNCIISKGTTFNDHSFAFYITAGNKLGLNIGPYNYISTGPATFVTGQWYHVAAMWTGGPNFTVRLYVNGQLDNEQTHNLAMPTNSAPATIGKYYSASGYFNGYIDEVRLWGSALSQGLLKTLMFNSCRASSMPTSMAAAWNFDGNLLNFGSGTGINGSFNTGGTNTCRFSAFLNETTGGTITSNAHPTVLNRGEAPNPFPQSYYMRTPNKPIVDASTTKDTINIPISLSVSSVELFISLQHTYTADLDIVLRAPNGTTREISTDNGGSSDNGYLTVFRDGSTLVTTADFFAPFSNLAGPEVTMGNFGGTNAQGNWILEVTDDIGGDAGRILGWGLRFNNLVTSIENISTNTPGEFSLGQNYPNPFNPTTTIKIQVPKDNDVMIKVYDILGKEVTTLLSQNMKPGTYEITFDGKSLSSGTYFYKMTSGDFTDIKKMVLIK